MCKTPHLPIWSCITFPRFLLSLRHRAPIAQRTLVLLQTGAYRPDLFPMLPPAPVRIKNHLLETPPHNDTVWLRSQRAVLAPEPFHLSTPAQGSHPRERKNPYPMIYPSQSLLEHKHTYPCGARLPQSTTNPSRPSSSTKVQCDKHDMCNTRLASASSAFRHGSAPPNRLPRRPSPRRSWTRTWPGRAATARQAALAA